ncbi:hypothetical protein [Streptomyces inhibens]|uniref:hypothetical protein n=1 Tax=Streptomyces inhibens TaxID=2293571 RepID=UPI0015F26543|nr:hypothetical protein [Streptomyces inhibens]
MAAQRRRRVHRLAVLVQLGHPRLERPLPLGERGEIIVRGPSVMTRYRNAPDATGRALREGRLPGRHPDVLAAAVVAVDAPSRGRRPYAYARTVPDSALTAQALRDCATGRAAASRATSHRWWRSSRRSR